MILFLGLVLLVITNLCTGIYVPGDKVVVHHNYSKVSGYTQSNILDNSPPKSKFFPVYHAQNITKTNTSRPIFKRRIEKPIEVYSKCPPGTTGQFVYETSCNQFLNCWKGRGQVQNCAPGTLFNPKTLSCDFPAKVECLTGPRKNSIKQRSGEFIPQIACPEGFTGLIPNYTDCSKFINCNHGQPNAQDCPPGTLFDVTTNICDHAYKAVCFNGQGGDGKLDFTHASYQNHNSYGNQGGYNCPPGTSNCLGGRVDQNQRHLDHGQQNSYQTSYDGSRLETNQGLQGQHGGYNCPPRTSNCQIDASKRQFQGSGQQTIHYGSQLGSKQGLQGQPRCPPGTTNCLGGQVHETNSQFQGSGQQNSHQTSYVSRLETNQGLQGQHGGYNCPPGTSNCLGSQIDASKRQFHGSGQQTQQTIHYGSQLGSKQGLQGQPRCPPGTTNCLGGQVHETNSQFQGSGQQNSYQSSFGSNLQTYPGNQGQNGNYQQPQGGGSYYQTSYGSRLDSNQGSSQTSTGGSGCPPGSLNCPQKLNQGDFSQNHLGQGRQDTNYARVCNINDPNCQKKPAVKCPEGFQGIHKHPTDCSKFLNCANGATFIQDCAPGTLFSPSLKICDFPYKVTCEVEDFARSNQEQFGQSGQSQKYEGQGHGQGYNGHNSYYQGSLDQKPTNQASFGQNNYHQTQNQGDNFGHNQGYSGQNSHHQGSVGQTTQNQGSLGQNSYHQERLGQDFHDQQSSAQTWYPITTTKPQFKHQATTPQTWPPPFPSTDLNADYVYEYEDGEEVQLQPENVHYPTISKGKKCDHNDFHCDSKNCVPKTWVCNGKRDCLNGNDEKDCEKYLEGFVQHKNARLAVLEKQRWDNVTFATCAMLCDSAQKIQCKSFNYRKIDKTCFLSDLNIGLSGALISYYPCDYYELKSTSIDCTNLHKCSNNKCITQKQICDGLDDCGDRSDEKNCDPSTFKYKLKLLKSSKPHEGLIEVSAFGTRGFVCDDSFGLKEGEVVCKELGFPLGVAEVKRNGGFEGNHSYLMDDVNCNGDEARLMDCDFRGWGVHDCGENELAGVVCKTPNEKCAKDQWKCDTGGECIPLAFVCDGLLDCKDESDEGSQHCEAPNELRLASGGKTNEGRVEIRHHGIWGTVCDDDFNEDAAKVICRYLGFRGKAVVKKEGHFGAGEGPIWLDQVYCYGNETKLEDCIHWNWGENNCEHEEDVGVICSNDMNIEEVQRNSKAVMVEPPITCGFRKDNMFAVKDEVHFRVIKGSLANPGEYPWQAALRVQGHGKAAHWCGAVVVSPRWVLTAAHCLSGYAKSAYVVVAGDYNVDETEGTEQQAFIDEFIIHENFREGHKMNNDIALIKLKGRGFKLNQDVQAICLPDSNEDYERMLNCTISGFGSVQSGKSAYSHNLRAGWIPIQKSSVCKMPHIYGDAITDGMICAGNLEEGTDACDGDSGGPLACLNQGVFTLYGMTSWGQHCGYANKPGVYVKVAHYRNWIDDVMQKYS